LLSTVEVGRASVASARIARVKLKHKQGVRLQYDDIFRDSRRI
jgi:hypothetical protein